ncbi:putative hydrolase [Gordonia hirsuta DSM 44140 = NBRC 16056]|uniref:Putative hydrolase n=1 Tax=Gordonia hirsuta DSM 44140 = NBRC 16056 TaxID=1121927 RepID=L7LB81_9ACTN|nr:alpha/beta fold hydrolase [Gordonia hirsuta]GAC57327.1 putative hydrolase [Gordonia hirsuta DSM 44140 = NBRC 16056]
MLHTELATLARVLRDDIAPHSHSESAVLSDRPHARLIRYGTPEQLTAARAAGTVPVLLVPPLAVPARCYDLAPGSSPGNSVVEFLLAGGTIPYVIDFGPVTRAERRLGFEDYFDSFVPRAIRDVVDDFRGGGDAVDLLGWSLGGTLSLMTAANDPGLPIRSIMTVGTPLDYMKLPPYPLVRRILAPTGGRPANYVLAALAGIPAPLVQLVYRGFAWERELKKPWYILKNLNDDEALARMQVIDRFQRSLPGYPGKVAQQMLANFIVRAELGTGVLRFDDLTVDLRSITAPVFMVGSHLDAIATHAAVAHGEQLFTASSHVEFHTVESSHLGMLTGAAAEQHTWPAMAAFRARLDAERLPS